MTLKEIIDNSDNIVFFGGAGISTESGIPDFRSEKGIYKTVQDFGCPPEEILSHTFFMKKPDIFYAFYRSMMIYPDAQPNKAHSALASLEAKGKLRAVITQNIDGLHQKAGSRTVYELHGSIHRNYCMKCGRFYGLDTIVNSHGIPRCGHCGGIIKPDVVLYEEGLDSETMERSVEAIARADVLIVGGTSLAVYPAAGFIQYYRGNKLVLINKGKTSYDRQADVLIHESLGSILGEFAD